MVDCVVVGGGPAGLAAPLTRRARPRRRARLLHPPETLDARTLACVVWCTGYTGDFSWLGRDLLDGAGRPLREGVRTSAAGVYVVELRWLTRRSSGNLLGTPADAAMVAAAVASLGRR